MGSIGSDAVKLRNPPRKKGALRRNFRRLNSILLCAATALCLSNCVPSKATTQPNYNSYKEEPDSFAVDGYKYKMYVDYERIANQATKCLKQYLKTGDPSRKGLFLTSLEMLLLNKDPLKEMVNREYLFRDPVFLELRNAYRKKNPDGDVYTFLDQIDDIRKNKDKITFWMRMKYGKDFIDAVLKHSE